MCHRTAAPGPINYLHIHPWVDLANGVQRKTGHVKRRKSATMLSFRALRIRCTNIFLWARTSILLLDRTWSGNALSDEEEDDGGQWFKLHFV